MVPAGSPRVTCGRGDYEFGIFRITHKPRTKSNVAEENGTENRVRWYFLRLQIWRGGCVCSTVVRLYRLSVLPKNSSPNGRTILSNDLLLFGTIVYVHRVATGPD